MLSCSRLISIVVFLPTLGLAQFGSGIQGTITDSSGAIIPGARVTVTNTETGIAREAVASDDGLYRVLSLNQGSYTVHVEHSGFGPAEERSVVIAANEIRKLDFSLVVGNISEKVTVEARTSNLETEQARVSGTLNTTQLRSLPSSNRNVYNLLVVQPGVAGRQFNSDAYEGEPAPSVRAAGQRSESNYFTVDDESINSISRGGTVNMTPSLDSVAEVRVVSHSFSAENGRNSGAQIQVVSKTGTNEFHGTVTEFFQNNTLASRNTFEASVPVNRQNQFGYSLGGPIKKNRTFFFTSYEGVRRSGARASLATVETQELHDWVMRTRPNSIAAKLLDGYKPVAYPTTGLRDLGTPLPGVNVYSATPDGIPDVGTITVIPVSIRTGNQFNLRVDHELRPGRDRLYGNFYWTHGYSSTTDYRPQFVRPQDDTTYFANINETHTFGPNLLNEFRAGMIRLVGQPAVPQNLNVPAVTITGSSGFQNVNSFPGGWFQTSLNVKNTVSGIFGNHNVKIGGELRRMRNNLRNTVAYIPNYSFASILDFVDDEAIQMTRNVDPRTGLPAPTDNAIRLWEGGVFVQDDWKARPNLTFNLGLRWEYYGAITDANDRLRNFIFGPGSNYGERLANGRVDKVSSMWTPNLTNFGPRFGFAWDQGGKGKTVVRGGYGISYDRLATVVPGSYRSNPPFNAILSRGLLLGNTPFTYSLGDVSKPYFGYPVDASFATGLDSRNGIRGSRVSVIGVDPGFSSPYAHDWFFGVQRSLPGQLVADIGYTGTSGHHLVNVTNTNRYEGDLLDGRFEGPNPSFSSFSDSQTTSNSIYHGMILSVSRRLANGFTIQGSYTFGKVITDAETAQSETSYQDANNRNRDRSLASFDVRHRVAAAGTWALPWLRTCPAVVCKAFGGWELSGSAVFESGNPFSVYSTATWPRGDFNADGTNWDFPNAPGASIKRADFTRSELLSGMFPTSAFPIPTAGIPGNLGRNVFRGPGFARTDLALAKVFRITERVGFMLRLEGYNAFNRVNLNQPISDLNSNNFGRVTTAQSPRQMQIGAQIRF